MTYAVCSFPRPHMVRDAFTLLGNSSEVCLLVDYMIRRTKASALGWLYPRAVTFGRASVLNMSITHNSIISRGAFTLKTFTN